MSSNNSGGREGSLEAPKRHVLDWQNPAFYSTGSQHKKHK